MNLVLQTRNWSQEKAQILLFAFCIQSCEKIAHSALKVCDILTCPMKNWTHCEKKTATSAPNASSTSDIIITNPETKSKKFQLIIFVALWRCVYLFIFKAGSVAGAGSAWKQASKKQYRLRLKPSAGGQVSRTAFPRWAGSNLHEEPEEWFAFW